VEDVDQEQLLGACESVRRSTACLGAVVSEKKAARSVPADPSRWSEKSQQTISVNFVKQYVDIDYNCWRCKRAAVFTAEDQRYTFEVRKAPIDQRRILCGDCWKESLVIAKDIASNEIKWKESKSSLQKDVAFLENWLQLLTSRETYVPYHPNTATKKMLQKLIQKISGESRGRR
jgi:hypothetical protein